MRNRIHCAVSGVGFGHGIGRGRVENRNFWEEMRRTQIEFLLRGVVREHRDKIHFRAGRSNRQNGQHRQCALRLFSAKKAFPDVAIRLDARCNRFRFINHAAAADRNHQINLLAFCDRNSFIDMRQNRVRLHAGKFDKPDARLPQRADDLIINAVRLDARFAIDQQRLFAVLRGVCADFSDHPLAEHDFRRIPKCKILHSVLLLCFYIACFT